MGTPGSQSTSVTGGKLLCVSAAINTFTGYGQAACEFIAGLSARGWAVEIKPISLEETCHASVPCEIKDRITSKPKAELELLITPMDRPNIPTPGKKTVLFSMWEATRLSPRQVSIINRAHAAITTGLWQRRMFQRSGVTVPVYTVPLGISPEIFVETPFPIDRCVFGAAGRGRKRMDFVIEAFRHAFDGVRDAELRLKVHEKLDLRDPRVHWNAEFTNWASLQRWFQGLTAFVNVGMEGWGLMAHQAMACGRPVLTIEMGGSTEFFNRHCGYPVDHWLQWNSMGDRSVGAFGHADFLSLTMQMRRIYIDRQEAADKGQRAAVQARRFTWEHAADKLDQVLEAIHDG